MQNENPLAALSRLNDTPRKDWPSILNRCIACNATAKNVGVWVPSDEISKWLGAPKGKTRMVPYGACDKCLENRPQLARKAEETIMRDYLMELA